MQVWRGAEAKVCGGSIVGRGARTPGGVGVWCDGKLLVHSMKISEFSIGVQVTNRVQQDCHIFKADVESCNVGVRVCCSPPHQPPLSLMHNYTTCSGFHVSERHVYGFHCCSVLSSAFTCVCLEHANLPSMHLCRRFQCSERHEASTVNCAVAHSVVTECPELLAHRHALHTVAWTLRTILYLYHLQNAAA